MKIRRVDSSEGALLQEAMALVWQVFSKFEAPGYRMEGVENFRQYITWESLESLLENPAFQLWCAFESDEVAGVLAAVCTPCHVSLLFVDERHHRKGIAGALIEEMIYYVKENYPEETTISVNASPYALEAYRRMGFGDLDEEQEVDGMRFIPMLRFIK